MIRKIDDPTLFFNEWERVTPLIESALEYQLFPMDIDRLKVDCLNRKYLLWTGERSCALTTLCTIDNVDVCHLDIVAGDLDEILGEGQDAIIAYAKKNNCKGLHGTGRKGWGRILQDYGFDVPTINVFKEI